MAKWWCVMLLSCLWAVRRKNVVRCLAAAVLIYSLIYSVDPSFWILQAFQFQLLCECMVRLDSSSNGMLLPWNSLWNHTFTEQSKIYYFNWQCAGTVMAECEIMLIALELWLMSIPTSLWVLLALLIGSFYPFINLYFDLSFWILQAFEFELYVLTRFRPLMLFSWNCLWNHSKSGLSVEYFDEFLFSVVTTALDSSVLLFWMFEKVGLALEINTLMLFWWAGRDSLVC